MRRYFDARTNAELSEAEALDENGILRDGCRMTVPMRLRDAARETLPNAWWQTGTASAEVVRGRKRRGVERDPEGRVMSTWEEEDGPWEDAFGVPDAVRRDPRYCNDARFAPQWDAVAEAYERRRIEDENAWKNPPARDPIFGSDGDPAPGYSADADQLNPHSRSFNLDAARAARDEAFTRYDEEQENAWRRGA